MFLKLSHTNLDVFKISKELVINCYKESKKLPVSEKFGLISQIRRAAISVHLNIAEGCSRSSITERRRFYEIARGSLVEIDTAFDISIHLNFVVIEDLKTIEELLNRSFQLLSGMMK